MKQIFCKSNLRLLLLWALFSLSFSTFGQNRSFEYIKYGTKEGLPSSEAYEILQDKRGNIWFSTDAGVSRFNGYEFENFNTNHGLTDNTVFHMYEDFKGRIWFLTYNSQLCYFENEKIHPYKYNYRLQNIIPNEYIRSISIDSNETITFVGRRFGIGSIKKDGTYDYRTTIQKPLGKLGFYQQGKDLLVYGLRSTDEENEIDQIDFNNGFHTNDFQSSFYQNGIYQFQLSKDAFFVSVGGFLGYKTKNDFRCKKPNNGAQSLNKVYLDREGRVWLASHDKGIEIYKNINEAFEGTNPVERLFTDKNVSSIFEDNSGGIWLAVQNSGIYYIPNSNILVHNLGRDELTNRVSSLYQTDEGELFAGTYNGRIYQLDSEKIPERKFENWTTGTYIKSFSVHKDRNGVQTPSAKQLITTKNGLKITFSTSHLHVASNGITIYQNRNVRVNSVFEDQDGAVWIGLNNGLFSYKKGQLLGMGSESSLFKTRIEDIDQLKDGTLLLGTKSKGLILRKHGKISTISESDGLTSNIVTDLFVDDDENIWISTPNGLNRLMKSSDNHYKIQKITEIHGLPTREVNRVTAVGDVIWVATNKGVASFNKRAIKLNPRAPILYFDDIIIGNKKVDWQSSYILPYGHNYVQLNFTGLSYRSQGKSLYRYRMLGISDEWRESNSRNVNYPSLMNGSYIFEVQFANEDGVWSKSRKIGFEIAPPFWKTWWFISLIGIVTLSILFLIFKLNEAKADKKAEQVRLLEKEKLLTIKSELKALRSQMNPHFTFNTLSAIQTAVNNSDTAKASKYIGDFASLLRKVLNNSRNTFINLFEELEMIQLYVELEQLRFSHKFSFEIEMEKELDMSYYQIPSMVIQPYIENAIIHGLAPQHDKPGKLKLNVRKQDGFIRCTIIDNGIGRARAMEIKKLKGLNHKSLAMKITEDRIDLFQKITGAEYSADIKDLSDADGPAGTLIELKFPC